MIYFDNAASGGFKPNTVLEAVSSCLKFMNANPGRSGHRLALALSENIYLTRKLLAEMFNAEALDRVIFTKNCTESLNMAILGTVKPYGHIITTIYEHNSVLRPLKHLESLGLCELTFVSPKTKNAPITALDIKPHLKANTYLVAVNHISNVTGTINDVYGIGAMLKGSDILFLVDGAQSSGHLEIDLQKIGCDLFSIAPHKSLYGIQGLGVLIFSKRAKVNPITFGGTGTMSQSLSQPENYPECLESGTLNSPAILALLEGIRYLKNNLVTFKDILLKLSEELILGLSDIPEVLVYSKPNEAGIVSFEIKNLSSQETADILNEKYDIAVRGGFHCAPLCHKHLQTDGLVRVSLSPHNRIREIRFFLLAIKEICAMQN